MIKRNSPCLRITYEAILTPPDLRASDAPLNVLDAHPWMIYTDDKMLIGPRKTPNLNMRVIYFGSCYFGTKWSKWEAMFPNAEVIGHDPVTYKTTGWMYLVFKSWIDLFASYWT